MRDSCYSKAGGVECQARVGQVPEFLEALLPGMYVGPVIDNEGAARLVDVEATDALAAVGQKMGIREMAQIVRGLPRFDQVREARNQLQQARRVAFERPGVMKHDADPAQGVVLQKSGQQVEAGFRIQLHGGEIPIENQQLALRTAQDRIACLPIFGLTVE